jgi:hypothetical protein
MAYVLRDSVSPHPRNNEVMPVNAERGEIRE